jgi:hypothetical protein
VAENSGAVMDHNDAKQRIARYLDIATRLRTKAQSATSMYLKIYYLDLAGLYEKLARDLCASIRC